MAYRTALELSIAEVVDLKIALDKALRAIILLANDPEDPAAFCKDGYALKAYSEGSALLRRLKQENE